jgi:hypothetical protein
MTIFGFMYPRFLIRVLLDPSPCRAVMRGWEDCSRTPVSAIIKFIQTVGRSSDNTTLVEEVQ